MCKDIKLVNVKVVGDDGSGTTAGVIAGINWVVSNAVGKKAVANLSIGGSYSATLNTAVNSAVTNGVTFVVIAGNSASLASNFSPGSAANAITVASIDSTDTRASSSNYGPALDIFAPGVGILSAWIGGGTATLSGSIFSVRAKARPC